MHQLTHSSNTDGCRDAVGWHVSFFARLIRGLADTEDSDGRTLLDNTAVVLLFEGGCGHDPQSGNDNSPHSTENMVALVGGRAGGLIPRGHLRAPEAHPARVVASAMQAVGLEDRLGDIEGRIPELF